MKRIYIILGVLVSLFSAASCNKWLDLQPQDGITRAEFWKTKEDARAFLYGIYSRMSAGPLEQTIFLWGELRADMIVPTALANEDSFLVQNMNIFSTNSLAAWGTVYQVINDCNLLIDNIDEAKAGDPTFTDELYNAYVGEALTIRGLMYFYLVRTFRDVPLKLTGVARDSDIVPASQVSDSQLLDQIIQDLVKAQGMVPDYHSRPASNQSEDPVNKGRVTKPAVHTLLADVYLWLEEYEKAELEIDKVLSARRYRLLTNTPLSIFQGGSVETIWEINHESVENRMFYVVADRNRTFVANNMYLGSIVFPSNLDVDTDLRDTRGVNFLYTSGGIIEKYGVETPSYYSFLIYRVSDAMLIKAEALAGQEGRGAEALELIEELRTARAALQSTAQEVDENDGGAIMRYIIDERAREFAFEGKRWFDVLRFARKNNYSNMDILVEVVSTMADAEVLQSALNKIQDPNSHYLPIFEDELYKANAHAPNSLKQNPFYLK